MEVRGYARHIPLRVGGCCGVFVSAQGAWQADTLAPRLNACTVTVLYGNDEATYPK